MSVRRHRAPVSAAEINPPAVGPPARVSWAGVTNGPRSLAI